MSRLAPQRRPLGRQRRLQRAAILGGGAQVAGGEEAVDRLGDLRGGRARGQGGGRAGLGGGRGGLGRQVAKMYLCG